MSRVEQLLDPLLMTKQPTSEQPGRDDWQRTFGMFAGDPVMLAAASAEPIPGL